MKLDGKLKVFAILGTRPEIIRLSACIKTCERHFDFKLIHTGQNWDHALNQIFFDELKLRAPDYYLNCAGGDLGETIGNVIARSYSLLLQERPDAVLLLGDTNSALCAISAKRLKIPIFHMEAGNRCYDNNVPEEINRKIVDHTSDINLAYTEHARRQLLSEGLAHQYIFVTGSPMREVLEQNREAIDNSGVLARQKLQKGKYIILSAHREENIDHEGHFLSLMNAVNEVAEKTGLPIIFSTHPRSKKRIEAQGFVFHPLVRSLPPFGFHDYAHLQKHAYCVLSDSGTLCEESAMLSFPAVLIRTSTERPEGIDKGSYVIGGIEAKTILPAIELARSFYLPGGTAPAAPDYMDGNVSDKVVRIIQGYTGIVNRRIWMK